MGYRPCLHWRGPRSTRVRVRVRSLSSLQLLYLLQAAAWIVTAASHVWLEERHKV